MKRLGVVLSCLVCDEGELTELEGTASATGSTAAIAVECRKCGEVHQLTMRLRTIDEHDL